MTRGWVFFLFIFFSISCRHSITSEKELFEYLHKPENGLCKTIYINHRKVQCKFIPNRYLELRDSGGTDKYNGSKYFLFTIYPDGIEGNVLFTDVYNYDQYEEKIYSLNFGLQENLTLIIGGKEYPATVSSFENNYSLMQHCSFTVAFSPFDSISEFEDAKEFSLLFNDIYFGTGLNRFVFKANDIKRLPFIAIDRF